MLIVGKDVSKIKRLKEELFKSFGMNDLGPAQQILGMHIYRDRKVQKLWLSQGNAKPVSKPLANHFKLSKKSCVFSKEEMIEVPYS